MATTELSPIALPGKPHSFSSKAPPVWVAAKIVGFDVMSGKQVNIQGMILLEEKE